MLWFIPFAFAQAPSLLPISEGGVHVASPEGWKTLIEATEESLVMSLGLYTTLTLFWYDDKPFADDKILDHVLRITNENLWVGEAVERGRRPLPAVGGAGLEATVTVLGYTLHLAFVIINDPFVDRLICAVLLTDGDHYQSWSGLDFTATIAGSLWVDGDQQAEARWRPPEHLLYNEPQEAPMP